MVNLKMGNHMDTASMNQNLVNSILVNGKMEINMEKELNSLNKELTLANGSATKSKGQGHLKVLQVRNMKVNGTMEWQMGLEYLMIKKKNIMKETGSKGNPTVKDQLNQAQVEHIKVRG